MACLAYPCCCTCLTPHVHSGPGSCTGAPGCRFRFGLQNATYISGYSRTAQIITGQCGHPVFFRATVPVSMPTMVSRVTPEGLETEGPPVRVLSKECPCGIMRIECEYHRPEPDDCSVRIES